MRNFDSLLEACEGGIQRELKPAFGFQLFARGVKIPSGTVAVEVTSCVKITRGPARGGLPPPVRAPPGAQYNPFLLVSFIICFWHVSSQLPNSQVQIAV